KLRVSAREQRGQGGAEATVALSVEPQDGGSHARMSTDLAVTGRVAQMGAGVMQEVANSMVTQFADCLSSRLTAAAPPPPEAPVSAAAGPGAEPTATAAPEAVPGAVQPGQEQSELRALPLVLRAIGARIRAIFKRG